MTRNESKDRNSIMTNIHIRPLSQEERTTVPYKLGSYAFRPTPPLPDYEQWLKRSAYYDGSFMGVFDGDTALAVAGMSAITEQIRGTFYACAGLWGVTTDPMARRQGHTRDMLIRFFASMREHNFPFSTLYPFRESFYDRLGYVTFPQTRNARFSPQALQPLLKKNLVGHVTRFDVAHGLELYQAYLHKCHPHIHGMGLFADSYREGLIDTNDYWLAVAQVEGETKGIMLYQIKGFADTMSVKHFYYDDSQGKYLLLEWFARHIDHVKEIELALPPAEHPETWFPDLAVTLSANQGAMARIIDVAKIGGMHTGPGAFSAQITDPQCPWNEGSYRFATIDGTLQVQPTQEAECHLTIQGLTALVYGTHDPETFAIRGWGNPTPELQDTMRAIFPPMLPYLHEAF
jgi:predicted acetyltransferase